MSEGAPEFGQGNDLGTDQGNQNPPTDSTVPSINPAWNELLGVVPEQLHSQVTPHLQKWDQNYQSQIQKVHSQYEPWKPILDAGVTPQDADFALGLMNAISTNPKEVLSALQEWIDAEGGEGSEQQGQQNQFQQDPNQQEDFDISSHPKVQEMEQALQAVAQILLEQKTQEQQAAEDEELETELSELKDKFKDRGEFDEDYVLGIALNDPEITLEQAAERYYQIQDNILKRQRQPGPPVLGSGGAFPNTNADTSKLGSTDTRALVAQMLAQAQQQQ